MSNTEIIIANMELLIADGILTIDNEINTFIGWKMQGYKIKKGEKHIAEFPIWVKTKKKKETEEDEEEKKKKQRAFILKNSYWFSDQQVEKIK